MGRSKAAALVAERSDRAAAFVVYDPLELTPPLWAQASGAEGLRVFNPTLAPDPAGGWIMAYRVVSDAVGRRVALCRLDETLQVRPGSVTPLSDRIRFAAEDLAPRTLEWHADPRLFDLDGRLWISWNDGSVKPVNHQFLMELDPASLDPAGPARRVMHVDGQRGIEKNWMFFARGGALHAVYSVTPHRVLKLARTTPTEFLFEECATTLWDASDYEDVWGELRGGAQPVFHDGVWWNFGHSNRKEAGGRRYVASVCTFEADAPFAVKAFSPEPVPLPNPFGGLFEHPKLNKQVAEVVYPCGAAADGERWVLAYGINDERCAAATVSMASVAAALRPAQPPPPAADVDGEMTQASLDRARAAVRARKVPLFFWDAAGQRKGGPENGDERFQIGNFGDVASKEIFELISGRRVYLADDKTPERRFLSVGSVLHRAREGDVVWGSGLKGSAAKLAEGVRAFDVFAVRGPISYDFLRRRGIDVSRVSALFDPVSLYPDLAAERLAEARARAAERPKAPFLIVPHYREEGLFRRLYAAHADKIVSPDGTLEGLAEALLGAERVVSSSLHGLITAEALGVPAVWLRPVTGEDELKYYDYYLGTDRHRIVSAATLEEALRVEPMPLPRLDFAAMRASFPLELAKSFKPGLGRGETVRFEGRVGAAARATGARGFQSRRDAALIADRAEAWLAVYLRDAVSTPRLRLELAPEGEGPLTLALAAGGHDAARLTWTAEDRAPKSLDLRVLRPGPHNLIELHLRREPPSQAAARVLSLRWA